MIQIITVEKTSFQRRRNVESQSQEFVKGILGY